MREGNGVTKREQKRRNRLWDLLRKGGSKKYKPIWSADGSIYVTTARRADERARPLSDGLFQETLGRGEPRAEWDASFNVDGAQSTSGRGPLLVDVGGARGAQLTR